MSQIKLTQQQQQRYNNALDTAPLDAIINILCTGLSDVTNDNIDNEEVELDLF